MAGTAFSSLITAIRRHIHETTASHWSDAELVDHLGRGVHDLWTEIVDLHQEHFLTIDATNVSMAADATTLTGVPTDTYRIYLIEPRSNDEALCYFTQKDYNHPDFQSARFYQNSVDPQGEEFLFAMIGAGPPTGAPTVYVAPAPNSAVDLRFAYIPYIDVSAYTTATTNPIPGPSDNALIAWTTAWAKAKDRDDQTPDPEWLAIYKTEKASLRAVATPRSEQDSEFVEGFLEWLDY